MEKAAPYRILVVDDEERIVSFLRIKLRASGYEVATATNGVQALEQFQAHKPDLILLDVIMPLKNGFQTLEELRRTSQVPVILLTAKEIEGNITGAQALGADDLVLKPFNPDELVARIEALLKGPRGGNGKG